MRRPRRPLLLAAFSALLCFALQTTEARAAAAPQVQTQLEPDPIGVNELATFTVIVDTSGFGAPEVAPDFQLDNFQIAAGPFRSSSQSWVNGVTSSSLHLVWRLRPLAVGPASVRALRVEVGGQTVQLPDASIEIVADAPTRAAPPRSRTPPDPFGGLFGNDPFADDPFGRFDARRGRGPASEPKLKASAVAEPAAVWVGQQLVWRLLLDTQTDVTRVEPRQLPDFRGFWVRDITPDETPEPRWLEIGGEKYARVPVLERALFPLEPGRWSVPSVALQVLAQVVDLDFFRPVARPKAFELTAGATTITVKPLPPPPSGAAVAHPVVGRLDVAAKLDRRELEAGQAASLTLAATSDGNLQSLEAPELALPEGLRSFPPTRESEEKIVAGRLQTTVRWRYVLLADRAGRFTLPAAAIDYFDPVAASYQVARSAPLELAVKAGVSTPEPAVAQPAPAAPDPAGGSAGRGSAALFVAVATLLLLVAAGAVWSRRGQGGRSGRSADELRAALAAAETEPSARTAASGLEEAWRRFLAERRSLPRSLPAAQWPARLAEQGYPAELGRELATLFEELHFLAYAPELADVDAHRAEVLARSRRLLRRLR